MSAGDWGISSKSYLQESQKPFPMRRDIQIQRSLLFAALSFVLPGWVMAQSLGQPLKPVSVKASAFIFGHNPEHLIDGDLKTKWAGPSAPGVPSYAIFDFGGVVELAAVIIHHAQDAGEGPNLNTEDFALEWGTSAEGPWQTIFQVTDNMEPRTQREFPPVRTQYVQLLVTDSMSMNEPNKKNDDDIVRIPEIEFFGKRLEGAAAAAPNTAISGLPGLNPAVPAGAQPAAASFPGQAAAASGQLPSASAGSQVASPFVAGSANRPSLSDLVGPAGGQPSAPGQGTAGSTLPGLPGASVAQIGLATPMPQAPNLAQLGVQANPMSSSASAIPANPYLSSQPAPPAAAAAAVQPSGAKAPMLVGGIVWQTDIQAAHALAVSQNRNILVFFRLAASPLQPGIDQILADPTLMTSLQQTNVLLVLDGRQDMQLAARFKVFRFPSLTQWTPAGVEVARLEAEAITRQNVAQMFK